MVPFKALGETGLRSQLTEFLPRADNELNQSVVLLFTFPKNISSKISIFFLLSMDYFSENEKNFLVLQSYYRVFPSSGWACKTLNILSAATLPGQF